MYSLKNQLSFKSSLPYSTVLMLSFLLIGLFEIWNNVLFNILNNDVLPNLLLTHFLPIFFLYALKSLQYAALFLLFVVLTRLIHRMILMFSDQKHDTNISLPEKWRHITLTLYDLGIPAALIAILFLQYDAGPATLSYYFYFLSETISPLLKSVVDFRTLNVMIKVLMALLIAVFFVRFRVSRYGGFLVAFLLFLIITVVLPAVVFLLHRFTGVITTISLVITIVGALFVLLLLMRRLFTLGIYRWAELLLLLIFIANIAGTIYFFSVSQNRHVNIVHIILDTLRDKSFNDKTMPFLYSLKENAVYFPNSYSSSDNTVTSHNAIYYGKHPSNVGLEHGPFPETTHMEVLRSHGYRTVVVSANGRFCIVNGFNKGVQDFYETWKENNHVRDIELMTDYGLSDKFDIIKNYLTFYTKTVLNKTGSIDKKPLGHREYRYFNYEPAEIVNEFVKTAIRRHPASDPLYLFVNYLDPHAPYLAPTAEHISPVIERLKSTFPDIHAKLHFDHIAPSDTLIFRQIMLMWQQIDSVADKRVKDEFLTFCYEENLRYLDEQLRHLFTWLNEQGMFENTLFIITSDHGESIGEHDLYDHGNKRLYNTETKVPLMILFPERLRPIVKKQVVEVNTQSVDFFPTFVDLLGLNTDVKLNGESLLPFIFAIRDSSENDYSIAEYTNVRAITDNRYKLILRPNVVELYDLQDDPEELDNIAAAHPHITQKLRKKLDEMLKSTPVVARAHPDQENDSRYDAETLKLLKTLGYVK